MGNPLLFVLFLCTIYIYIYIFVYIYIVYIYILYIYIYIYIYIVFFFFFSMHTLVYRFRFTHCNRLLPLFSPLFQEFESAVLRKCQTSEGPTGESFFWKSCEDFQNGSRLQVSWCRGHPEGANQATRWFGFGFHLVLVGYHQFVE